MRKLRILIVLALVATGAFAATNTAIADTGTGQLGSITVEPTCVDDEPAREITVTANNDNDFTVGFFVTSETGSPPHFVDTLLGFYEPGESRSYTLPVSEYDDDMWNLFTGPDGDAAFHASASSVAGDCDDGGDDDELIYPTNNPKFKGNRAGVCKAVLVHVEGGDPIMTVELNDGSTISESGWNTGNVWHFEVNFDSSLTPVDAWVDPNGGELLQTPRFNVGRC